LLLGVSRTASDVVILEETYKAKIVEYRRLRSS